MENSNLKKEILQVLQDFSEQYGDTYENRCVYDNSFGELAEAMEKKFSGKPMGLEKPPIGLRPRFIVDESRYSEVLEAMCRYAKAKKEVPQEWKDEALELVVRITMRQYDKKSLETASSSERCDFIEGSNRCSNVAKYSLADNPATEDMRKVCHLHLNKLGFCTKIIP